LAFAIHVVIADSVLKCLLLIMGTKLRSGLSAALPFMLYACIIPFTRYFYLQRYDVFPALLTVCALYCVIHEYYGLAGASLVVATGVKLYPAVLIPLLGVIAIKRGRGVQFMVGTGIAFLPIVLLGIWLPWWEFLRFHSDRGIQVESLYASVTWLSNLVGFTEAQWIFVKAWTEVKGPLALAILPWAKLLMATTTFGSVAYAAWMGARIPKWNICCIARLALIPLLAFVSFNIVLSPQFMIWLLPLAVLGILENKKWPMTLIALGTAVVPIFYPSAVYVMGYNLFQTLVLLGRNLSLIVVWVVLIEEFWRMAKRATFPASLPSNGRME
jgi:hypothetical protein